MATTASAHLHELVAAGFPESTLQELEVAANQLEDAITTRGSTRSARVRATRQIAESLAQGREAVAMLDAVISRKFSDDPAFIAAWDTARRIHAKAGSPRGSSSVGNEVPQIQPSVEAAA